MYSTKEAIIIPRMNPPKISTGKCTQEAIRAIPIMIAKNINILPTFL